MNTQKRAKALVDKHGSYRAAAKATGISASQLHKLAAKVQTNPTVGMLRKLGLMK